MTLPLVSCIVPTHNDEQYLADSLDSILSQTYRPVEIIVADDGSTDGTADLLVEYEGRVTCVRQERKGPASARNLGLDVARGDFVAFLDADDVWLEEKLERQIARFEQRPNLDLLYTAFSYFWEPSSPPSAPAPSDAWWDRPISSCHISSLLARRAAFDTYGRLDPDLKHGEHTTWLIAAKSAGARFEVLGDVLVLRRLHPDSLTRIDQTETIDGFLHVLRTWRDAKRDDESR